MSKIPVIFATPSSGHSTSSDSKSMLPSASDIIKATAGKTIEVETSQIAEALKKLVEEFDSIASSPELKSSTAKKLVISLAIRADGSIGLVGLASARSSIQSSMALEFEIG